MQDNTKNDINELKSLLESTDTNKLSTNINLFTLKYIVKRNLFLMIIFFVVIATLGYLYVRYTKPTYESQAVIKIDIKTDATVFGFNKVGNEQKSNHNSQISSEIELLRSNLVHEEVVKNPKLQCSIYSIGKILDDEKYPVSPFNVDYKKDSNRIIYNKKVYVDIIDDVNFKITYHKDEDKEKSFKSKFGENINLNGFNFQLNKPFGKIHLRPGAYYFRINSKNQILNEIKSKLLIQPANIQANTIRITYKDYNKHKAKDIINSIIEVYKIKSIEKRIKSRQKTIEFINNQLDNVSDSLKLVEQKLEDFVKSTGMLDPKPEYAKMLAEKEKLLEKKIEISNSILNLSEISKYIDKSNVDTNFIPQYIQLSSYANQIHELNDLKKEFLLLKKRESPKTSVYKTAASNVKYNTKILKRSIDIALLQSKFAKDSIDNEIKKLELSFNNLPSRESQHRKLTRLYNLHEKFYDLFLNKKVQISIANSGIIEEFDVLQKPTVSNQPIHPIKTKVYATTVSIWLVICITFLAYQYFTRNKIINSDDLESVLKTPFLGSIPSYTSEKHEYSTLVVHKNPKSAISEALRAIRTNLNYINNKKEARIISVTSTISGEGKTFVAINLGGIIALSDKKVIILDLDMRKPKIHKGFNANNIVGVSTYIIGKSKLEDIIQKTELDSLDFIPSGSTPPNPSELIMRKEFQDLIDELKLKYDYIIIDSPPVGLVTDGIILMQKVDIPIYVVRSDYSKKGVEKNIHKIVEFNQINNLSVILNGVSKSAFNNKNYYGNGYGYGYGYYNEDENKPSFLQRILKK